MEGTAAILWMAGLSVLMVVLLLGGLAAVVVTALVQIVRSPVLDSSNRPLWTLVVLTVPLIGAVTWFASPERRQARRG